INHSETLSKCRIKLNLEGYQEEFELVDLMTDQKYLRSAEEISGIGLYVELKPYHTHIFKF
ncbi:MAG: glycosidase, partial [Melioribacteraceae bacterium]